jgi:hypothetical protein
MSSIDTYSSFRDSTSEESNDYNYIIEQEMQDEIFSGENKPETPSFVHTNDIDVYTTSSFNYEGEMLLEEEISSSNNGS